jgi:uncharacterized protein (DUF362 family)
MSTLALPKTRAVSVIHDRNLRYPEEGDYFSPNQAFPEYPFQHIARQSNPVYTAVRQCLAEAGLDGDNFGSNRWNPLGEYIAPGQRVFVLCNFVKHNITPSPEVMLAKCTHGSVVRAVMDYVWIALAGRGSVRIGNAALQSADWDRVTRETGARTVQEFFNRFAKRDVSVALTDLRQHIIRRRVLGGVDPVYHGDDGESCVSVDLGTDSLLDELYRSGTEPKFRVLDYDHRRTDSCHSKGRHVFLISKHILESDVLFSIPKLKTHEKVGFTGGIKGCVGAVAHKDCLAHHRYGPPHCGGDEYPDQLSILRPLSRLHDATYAKDPGRGQEALQLLNYCARIGVRRFTRSMSGSWPGNDTCWRMAVDLARIVQYATSAGRLELQRQRPHIMLTDGIVAGEGDGPLSPRAAAVGYLSFCDNLLAGDYVNCLAMGFDPDKIPMIRESFRLERYRIAEFCRSEIEIQVNGNPVQSQDVNTAMGRKLQPPREWRGYL